LPQTIRRSILPASGTIRSPLILFEKEDREVLETETRMIGTVTALELRGRFDAHGAAVFEQEVQSLDLETCSLVVDVSGVNYVSSMGLRALLKIQKNLKRKGRGVILASVPPFMKKVLELSGLLHHFACASGSEEAALMAGREYPSLKVREEKTTEGRKYRLTDFEGNSAALDMWGSPDMDPGKGIGPENLTNLTLLDLGIGFGIGGLGRDRDSASQALGEFVAAAAMAAVVPAGPYGEPDYLIGEDSTGSEIFTASAVSFTGAPACSLECKEKDPIPLAQLVDEVMEVAGWDTGAGNSLVGMVLFAGLRSASASRYGRQPDMPAAHPLQEIIADTQGMLCIGIAASRGLERSPGGMDLPWFLAKDCFDTARGNSFHGHALFLRRFDDSSLSPDLEENLQGLQNLELLSGAGHMEPGDEVLVHRVWLYRLLESRRGSEKLLKIEVEQPFSEPWDQITRRLFPDAQRVVLDPLHGGYMGKTFRVIPYSKDGRRMLPSVLKLGPEAAIEREVRAFHEHVEKYILNNSTSIMGRASSGEWGGIRYTFVGIGGPESRLTWLAEHYRNRSAGELLPLLHRLFTHILKPWYGQPRWEEIRPYAEHNPIQLFPHILEDGEKATSISQEEELLPCPELNLALPNPFHFLKYGYPARKDQTFLWYRCVSHGDLNMQNILLDESENIFVIDFSETRVRNAVSDFARLEVIVKIEMTRMQGEPDLKNLLRFEDALVSASRLGEIAPFRYEGDDPMVEKAYRVVSLLRGYSDRVTLFEENIVPYFLALLEWTYPIVCYRSATLLQKRFAAYSAGLIVKRIMELE